MGSLHRGKIKYHRDWAKAPILTADGRVGEVVKPLPDIYHRQGEPLMNRKKQIEPTIRKRIDELLEISGEKFSFGDSR